MTDDEDVQSTARDLAHRYPDMCAADFERAEQIIFSNPPTQGPPAQPQDVSVCARSGLQRTPRHGAADRPGVDHVPVVLLKIAQFAISMASSPETVTYPSDLATAHGQPSGGRRAV